MAGKRKLGQVYDYSPCPLSDPFFRKEFARDISSFWEELEKINKLKETFRIDPEDNYMEKKKRIEDDVFKNQFSRSARDDLFLGRKKDMQELKKLLLTEGVTDNTTLPVIALVGMGGVGKTTLAQRARNDPGVAKCYSMIGWVYVSDNFDVQRLTRATLETLKVKFDPNQTELSTLQKLLKDAVSQSKFLLFLDDIWNESVQDWATFYSSLKHGAKGSKIVITTRSHIVARKTKPLKCIKVGCLSKKAAWALFRRSAFENYKKCKLEDPALVAIGEKIATKCNGLPLAIKVLCRYLRYAQHDKDAWEHVLESDLWEESMWEDGKMVLGPLTLSYLHLPAHLKPCFLICSVLPKGELDMSQVVSLWMVHDLVEYDNYMEASRNIDGLVSRSFLTCRHENGAITIHDFIHDLAQYISRDERFELVNSSHVKFKREVLIPRTVHHAVVDTRYVNSVQLCDHNNYTSRLRTFIELEDDDHVKNVSYALIVQSPEKVKLDGLRILTYREPKAEMNCGFLQVYTRNLRNLRRLQLYPQECGQSKIRMDVVCALYNLRSLILSSDDSPLLLKINLPDSIGNLTHLKHLHIAGVNNVPESLCRLNKLEVLNLDYAQVSYLPKSISQLVNLRELILTSSDMRSLPESIGKLKYLHTLKLDSCKKLWELPKSIVKLINLMELNLYQTREGCYVPAGFRYLTNLYSLRMFRVSPETSRAGHSGIKELKNLVGIAGLLSIFGLNNVIWQDAAQAQLVNKAKLTRLELRWAEGGSSCKYIIKSNEKKNGSTDINNEAWDAVAIAGGEALASTQDEIVLEF